jgi:hypothetical protein
MIPVLTTHVTSPSALANNQVEQPRSTFLATTEYSRPADVFRRLLPHHISSSHRLQADGCVRGIAIASHVKDMVVAMRTRDMFLFLIFPSKA